MYVYGVLVTFCLYLVQGLPSTPALVETTPNLLDSFIPAGMQIIAHITELMKFDLKPQSAGPSTLPTTTTQRPTRPHSPGVFAPSSPPGPAVYFAKSVTYAEYVERLKNPTGGYFDRYFRTLGDVPEEDIDTLLGRRLGDMLRLANTVEEEEDEDDDLDVDEQVQEFHEMYDDSDFRLVLLKQKRKPPTRAYVSLLSLYDLLNKESKKLGLNKYNGYAQQVLVELVEFSKGTSVEQLRAVLAKIAERKDTKKAKIIQKINELVKDLGESSSYICAALRDIPPLPFVL